LLRRWAARLRVRWHRPPRRVRVAVRAVRPAGAAEVVVAAAGNFIL